MKTMDDRKKRLRMETQLTQLVKKHGGITPTHLVAVSKPKSSITHDCFEWNDKAAGKEYRLYQARHWIRVIKVTVDDVSTPDISQLIKVSLAHVPSETGSGEGEYKPITTIIESPSDFERAFRAALADMRAATARVEELKREAEKVGDEEKVSVLASICMTLSTTRDLLMKLQ